MKKGPRPTDWRWGPAQYWYDMLELPEDCPDYDYGLRVVGKEEQEQMDKAVAGIPAGAQAFKSGQKNYCHHFHYLLLNISVTQMPKNV